MIHQIKIKENDPLSVLVVPHEVIEWQKKQGLLAKKFLPHVVKTEKEKGKFAIFHNKTRLNKIFEKKEDAEDYIDTLVGNKRTCIENKRVFKVKQL